MENPLPFAFLIAYAVCFFIQLYYLLIVHAKLRGYKAANTSSDIFNPVSVIICARNEEENLKQNLPLILEQTYSDFEVVLVNDCSSDLSEFVLRDLSLKYKHLKVVTINEHERYKHGKKFAVTLGIKAAKNEYLLFTDADCRPTSDKWLEKMQRNFTDGKEIVIGYSPYEKLPGMLNKLIRLETFYTAVNYLSFALKGNAYMAVGRNMGYTKSLFFRSKGFASHMHIPSGDDDLFVNQNATAFNTAIEIDAETQMWSEPKHSFSAYVNQKLRHLGAGKAYRKKHKQALTIQFISAMLFYILLFVLIGFQAKWYFIAVPYVLRLTVQLMIYFPIFKKLSYRELFFWLPALDLIYYFYILSLNIIILFKKKVQWR